MLLTGCNPIIHPIIPIPTPGKVLYGREFNNTQLEFIEINVTTKEQIIEQLGKPDWQDDQIFAYHYLKHYGYLCSLPTSCKDIIIAYSLIIKFNECDRVLCHKITSRPADKLFSEFIKDWSCD